MVPIPQSTAFTVVFKAYLSSDHLTEATGKTIAITISKAGGAFGNPAAGALNATEIASGWYKAALGTGDIDTLGILAIRGTAATIDDYGDRFFVVSATTGGLTNLDAAITTRMATYTQPTGFLSATFPAGTVANTTNITAGTIANVGTLTTYTGNTPQTGDSYARLGAPAGASTAADIAAVKAVDDAIKAKTDNLPSDPADESLIIDATNTLGTAIAALSIPTANQNADALLDRADAIETGLTPRKAMRLAAAADGGKLSGAATMTNTIRNAVADSKDRIVATVDADGNRTAIIYDLT